MNKITVGKGSNEEREIEVVNFIHVIDKDERDIKVIQLVNEEGFLMLISNPPTSERGKHQEMWLSVDSYLLMMFALGCVTSSCKLDLTKPLNNDLKINRSKDIDDFLMNN